MPSVTWQSRIFFDDNNDIPALQQPPNALVPDNVQDERQGGYALVNARLGYTLGERYTIEAFVTNLFDEDYILDAGNTGDAAGPADLHRRFAKDVRDPGQRPVLR